MDSDVIVNRLLRVFPRSIVKGPAAPHDCPECSALRESLSGVTWPEIPGRFIRDNPDVLPLLSHEAYLAFLPAWLKQGALQPDGEVASVLLVHLECRPDTTGLTAEQGEAVIEVAQFIVQNNGFGAEDLGNLKTFAAINHI